MEWWSNGKTEFDVENLNLFQLLSDINESGLKTKFLIISEILLFSNT